ncbi:MAG: hypothetical protein ACR2J8_06280 [Thermomicrobiales bacterium]
MQHPQDGNRSRRVWDSRLTAAELLERGATNFAAYLIETAGFLELQGIGIEEWSAHLGLAFASTWPTGDRPDADVFMAAMLVNYVAAGAVVTDAALGPDYSRAAIANYPPAMLCRHLGAPISVIDGLHGVSAQVARALGLEWAWWRSGREIICTAARLPAMPGQISEIDDVAGPSRLR